MPERKAMRRIVALLVVFVVAVVLWFWVFPWVDRTYVNRPAIEETTQA